MRSTSFETFVKEIFFPYAEANRKRHEQDKHVMHGFIDSFKGRALHEIPPMLIEQWKRKQVQAELKSSTVNQKLRVLHRVFSLAVENGYLSDNPVSKVRRLRETDPRERVMTYDEEDALLEVMENPLYCNLKLFFQIAVHTGMRANEVLGLRWSEVDFSAKEINLPYYRTKEGKDKSIPLNSFLVELLMERRLDSEETETVFGDGASYPQIGALWRAACAEAKVLNLHIHDLRHTFASRLLQFGHRETDINKMLGHSSLKMTKRYMHSNEASRRDSVESLAQEWRKGAENGAKLKPPRLWAGVNWVAGASRLRAAGGDSAHAVRFTASQRGRVAELKLRKNFFKRCATRRLSRGAAFLSSLDEKPLRPRAECSSSGRE
jgi:integrase